MLTGVMEVVGYGAVAGSATLMGIGLVLKWEKWVSARAVFFISFAAGMLLAVAFLHLLPEAQAQNPRALLYTLLTFLLFYALEHSLMIHACQEGDCPQHPMGWLAFWGIGLHSLLDGVIIGIGFRVGFSIGLATALAVFLHQLPVGMSLMTILRHAGFGRRDAILYSTVVALATPVGTLLALLFLPGTVDTFVGALLAVGAGSFLYVAASDLIPETHRNSRHANIAFVAAGGLFSYLVEVFLGR